RCWRSGQRAAVLLKRGSSAASFYDADVVTEEYRCSFGLAASYAPTLERAGLMISGEDANGEPRVVEFARHPFYLATLFVPQLSSQSQRAHPLFKAFITAVCQVPLNEPLQPTRSAHPNRQSDKPRSGLRD